MNADLCEILNEQGYTNGILDEGLFFLNIFHPVGELESPICCVIKGSK